MQPSKCMQCPIGDTLKGFFNPQQAKLITMAITVMRSLPVPRASGPLCPSGVSTASSTEEAPCRMWQSSHLSFSSDSSPAFSHSIVSHYRAAPRPSVFTREGANVALIYLCIKLLEVLHRVDCRAHHRSFPSALGLSCMKIYVLLPWLVSLRAGFGLSTAFVRVEQRSKTNKYQCSGSRCPLTLQLIASELN